MIKLEKVLRGDSASQGANYFIDFKENYYLKYYKFVIIIIYSTILIKKVYNLYNSLF